MYYCTIDLALSFLPGHYESILLESSYPTNIRYLMINMCTLQVLKDQGDTKVRLNTNQHFKQITMIIMNTEHIFE